MCWSNRGISNSLTRTAGGNGVTGVCVCVYVETAGDGCDVTLKLKRNPSNAETAARCFEKSSALSRPEDVFFESAVHAKPSVSQKLDFDPSLWRSSFTHSGDQLFGLWMWCSDVFALLKPLKYCVIFRL